VSFTHHAEVAALPEAKQQFWLDRVETDGLTRDQLRRGIRDELRAEQNLPLDEYWIMVRCNNVKDQEALADQFRLEGRVVKVR
jgi:hypothetical protein